MKTFQRLFALIPLGVGLCVLGFVWSQPSSGFGAVPTFLKLFFSLVAGAFVLTGLAGLAGAASPESRMRQMLHSMKSLQRELGRPHQHGSTQTGSVGPPAAYSCPNCGAPLDGAADVSPHGDVKCTHCDRWFNIHKH